MKRKPRIGIIGFGRFGKTLYRLLQPDFSVILYDADPRALRGAPRRRDTVIARSTKAIYEADTIFYAVPIRRFAPVIASHRRYFEPRHLLIDVLSVKSHPASVFRKLLAGSRTRALLTHPMFGPDSAKEGFEDLPIILSRHTARPEEYARWKRYFSAKGLRVIELSPRAHDKIAADSQGVTHCIGRLLSAMPFKRSPIDSRGAMKLHEVVEQTCNDSWELFEDLQRYNPYTPRMRGTLEKAYEAVSRRLAPAQTERGRITIGIQGGRGSFNEEALRHYLAHTKHKNVRIRYLHTSMRVLSELHKETIDRGQFAIHNSVGGIVEESIRAMAKFKFRIVEEIAIPISHALMIRPDASRAGITTIMTHPQVLAQCRGTLRKKYPSLLQTSGKGKMIDHSLVARALGRKKLPKHIATMGSKTLADLYGLTIVEDNLQDAAENYTTFLQVVRYPQHRLTA